MSVFSESAAKQCRMKPGGEERLDDSQIARLRERSLTKFEGCTAANVRGRYERFRKHR